jgi:metal transporter CNNM
MSLDETNLTILINSGTPEQRKYASLILPIRKNGHLLLVTLLLTNTLINESLPIFLDSVFGGGYIAILVSTGLILVFGEVIPQSICARHGLRIGAFFAW